MVLRGGAKGRLPQRRREVSNWRRYVSSIRESRLPDCDFRIAHTVCPPSARTSPDAGHGVVSPHLGSTRAYRSPFFSRSAEVIESLVAVDQHRPKDCESRAGDLLG